MTEVFEEISPADFFYRNRGIAGFTNPVRAVYSAIREIIENSLDASDRIRVPPDIYVRLLLFRRNNAGVSTYKLRVEDNGCGVPDRHIPFAFGQVLFGSKYKLRQARGTFGLGGTMAVLYGQITTHEPVYIASSTGTLTIYEYFMMIDIQNNRPIILNRRTRRNKNRWHGTVIEFCFEGDYPRAMSKILEYLKMTAIVNPHANITFIDPRGRLYKFSRITEKMPNQPKEILPHPFGVDVEMIKRLISITKSKSMFDFMKTNFHRVGNRTARNFLKFANIEEKKNPKKLIPAELVKLVQAMKQFSQFLPPDSACLSPLGRELMTAGILKELKPNFTAVSKSRPSTYSGHPFIVEVGIAYGGEISRRNDITLYRFANRIPLLYDEGSDVSWSVIRSINWRRYKVTSDMPVAVLVHICSTKIPYKTVGKEFIASIPEVRRELLNGIREVARQLGRFLSRQANVQRQRRRLSIFGEYLPKIARFSTDLSGKKMLPDISKLYLRKKVYEAYETTDFFSDSDIFEAKEYKTKLLHIYNKHSENSVIIRILVSRMGLFWSEFRSEVTLDPKSQMYEMITEKWHFLKIQAKSTSPDKPGLLDAYVDGLSE